MVLEIAVLVLIAGAIICTVEAIKYVLFKDSSFQHWGDFAVSDTEWHGPHKS